MKVAESEVSDLTHYGHVADAPKQRDLSHKGSLRLMTVCSIKEIRERLLPVVLACNAGPVTSLTNLQLFMSSGFVGLDLCGRDA